MAKNFLSLFLAVTVVMVVWHFLAPFVPWAAQFVRVGGG